MDTHFLRKGSLGITNRVINMIYGLGYLLLVVRGLPQQEYGFLALTMSIVFIVEVLRLNWITTASLKYLPALQEDKQRRSFFTTAVFMFGLLTLAVSALIYGLAGILATVFKTPALVPLFRIVPLYYVCTFLKSLTEWILISEQRLKRLVILNTIYTGASLGLLLILSYLGKLTMARHVIIVLSIGGLAASLISCFFSYRYLVNFGRIKLSTIKEMMSFGKFALGDNICGILVERLDIVMLGIFTNPLTVAVYNAGKRLADGYEAFLQGFWLVVYPTAARQVSNEEDLRGTYRKALTHVFSILIPIVIVAMFVARPGISLLLGKEYTESVAIFRVFSVNVLFRVFLVFGGSILIGGLNKINQDFYTMLVLVMINALLNLLLIPRLGFHGAAIAMVITTFIGAVIKNHLVSLGLRTNIFRILFMKTKCHSPQ